MSEAQKMNAILVKAGLQPICVESGTPGLFALFDNLVDRIIELEKRANKLKQKEDEKLTWPPKWALHPDQFSEDFDDRIEADLQRTGSLRG